MFRELAIGIGVMLGTIIGAGFLVLPYSLIQIGGLNFLGFLILLTAAIIFLHLSYGEVVISTQGKHRLVGYAKLYLGKWGERIASISILVGNFGGMLLYLILGGSFLEKLLPERISNLSFFVFWVILSVLIILKFKTSVFIDAFTSWILIVLLLIISGISIKNAYFPNIFARIDFGNWTIPYSAILFSLLGFSAIPEIASIENLSKDPKIFRKVIIFSTATAALIYGLFAITSVMAIGMDISPNAFDDIYFLLPENISWIIPLVGFISVGTSYFIFGLSTRNALYLDFGVKEFLADLIVVAVPMILFISGIKDIVKVIGFLGGVWISIDAFIILLMREKIEKNFMFKKIIGRVLMLIFVVGTIISLKNIK